MKIVSTLQNLLTNESL